MDKLSELNELIEDMEAVADKYYGKIKEESSNYLEVKEKCARVAKAIAYRNSPIGEFLRRRWERDYEKDLGDIETSKEQPKRSAMTVYRE